MTANAGYLFYKKYYKDIKSEDWEKIVSGEYKKERSSDKKKEKTPFEKAIDTVNGEIEILSPDKLPDPLELKGITAINLVTTNPGLLIGSGYSHETGIENEYKIGFFFDHTTGLPVIPGSSVKGVLRSVFPKPDEPDSKQNGKKSYLKNLLKGIFDETLSDKEFDKKLIKLEKAVFEGTEFVKAKESDKDEKEQRIPMAKRDIFFDARIIETIGNSGKIFGKDSITPHKHPLKNPIPLKFLKVLPGVVFQFSFRLSDVGGISADEKKRLFQDILLTIGAGAKTNVGYGQFVEYKDQSVNTIHTTA